MRNWQGWYVNNPSWDIVELGGAKRIRLKFSLASLGENTLFFGISYQVTATGDLIGLTPPPPPPARCDMPRLIADAGSSGSAEDGPYTASNVLDGDFNTIWKSKNESYTWLQVALVGRDDLVCRVDIAWADGNTRQYTFDIDVIASNNLTTHVLRTTTTGTTIDFERYEFPAIAAQYIKIYGISIFPPHLSMQISEVRVFGPA
jgi:F5/8 type C domain-containing protein